MRRKVTQKTEADEPSPSAGAPRKDARMEQSDERSVPPSTERPHWDETGSSSVLAFLRPTGGHLLVRPEAMEALWQHAQFRAGQPEAGGVLIGRHVLHSSDVIVDSVTVPLPGDRQSRFHFFRARDPHQAALDEAWRLSSRTQTYLGEWHTHPEPYPTPSGTDQRDWKRKLRSDRYTDMLFFLIAGTLCVRAWEGTRDGTLSPLATALPGRSRTLG